TDIMKFMFHSETNLANTDYRENRSMILSGLSLWEKGSPLHKSTQQVRTKARYGMRTAGRENWPIFSALEG
ncbi:hypothetical protein V4A88_RS20190, partial [Escherichia coli]